MWSNLTALSLSPLNLALRAALVYVAVLVLLRISGKKQIGQMGAVEFVTVLLISNAVQNSMNGGDNSLVGGLLLAATLIALSMAFARLSYWSRVFTTVFEGAPTLLIHEGALIAKSLRKELLTEREVHALLRKQGVHHIREVKNAILESDGTLSIVRYQDVGGAPADLAH